MPGKQHARCPSDQDWSPGSIALGAILLSAFLLPSLGYAKGVKQTARPLSVGKQSPECAPAESTPKKDLPTGSAASSDPSPQSTDESRIQESSGSDSMKLESGRKDDVQSSEPECSPGQSGAAGAQCEPTRSSKDSASQCVRDPALKPDLALDREPGK
jgi:hypothetical protein